MNHSATIFAIDTSSDLASLALHRDGRLLASQTLESADGFAHVIFPAIREFLENAGVQLADIDCFASACGPGSFTGVRVCLSVVKGLAAALHKPATGVSNLRALASLGNSPLRAPFIDARRGDLYGALYDANLSLVMPEDVMPFAAWRKRLTEYEYEIISSRQDLFCKADAAHREAPRSLAIAIAGCAALDGPEKWSDPAVLDANYVRRADAQVYWKDLRELKRVRLRILTVGKERRYASNRSGQYQGTGHYPARSSSAPGTKEGDRVEFVTEDGVTIIRPARTITNPFEEFVGALGTFPGGQEEINAWVADLRNDN